MRCPDCGHLNPEEQATCLECGGKLSVSTDTMDDMIEEASVPDLATLYRRGKEKGLLKPQADYGQSAKV